MIVTLLRPRYLGFRNRWRKGGYTRQRGQDIVIAFFCIGVLSATYSGTVWTLTKLKDSPFLVHLPPSLPLGLLLLLLMAMLWISSLVTSISSFYFADDLEILLAAPLKSRAVFGAKAAYITLAVSWMPMVFILPVLIAFGQVYDATWWYYPFSVAVLVPYFALPVAVSISVSALLMAVIDPRWTKALAVFILFVLLIGLYFVVDLTASVLQSDHRGDQVLRVVNLLGSADSLWSPAAWAGRAISEVLEPSGRSVFPRVSLLFCSMVSAMTFAYALMELFHLRGYTRAKNSRISKRDPNRPRPARSAYIIGKPGFALALKEFRGVFRDVAQSAQVLFLSCMCVMYLLNIRFFVAVDSFPEESRLWWQNLFFIVHCSVAAFFTTAICTRVVFSSISLEGRAYWLLQTAPLRPQSVLKAKFWFWFVPVAVVSAIVFAMGAFVISGRLDFVAVHLLSSVCASYGIVGLGIGLGAYFADFNWEHPSQLALGLGSFLYMLGSALLVFMNVVPTWLMLMITKGAPLKFEDILSLRGLLIVLTTVTIALVNSLIAKTAMETGEAALERASR